MSPVRTAVLACGIALGACVEAPQPTPPGRDVEPGWVTVTPMDGVRSLNDVVMLDGGLLFAVGTDGAILRHDANGWSPEDSGVTADLESIDGFVGEDGDVHLLAVGHVGTVVQRGASGWTSLAVSTDVTLFGVTHRSEEDAFIVGEAGTVLRFDGALVTVQEQQTLQRVEGTDGAEFFFPIAETLKGVVQLGDVVIAVGARGAVYTYDPSGEREGVSNR